MTWCWSMKPRSREAILRLLEMEKTVVEGAGAVP